MNDEGVYMFTSYAGKWIPDTPGAPPGDPRAAAQLERLQQLVARSKASRPRSRRFWSADRKISIYVLGDEFTGDSVDDVARRASTG